MKLSGAISFRPKLWSVFGHYSMSGFKDDLVAGIVVGIVALPLAIAFAIASGVSPTIGLITAIIGGFIVSAFGGNSVQIGGPTGAFIVIVYGIIGQFGLEGLAIATLMAGLILIMMGLFHLGTVIKFIPYPIVVGFTAGIALTIFSTQMNDFFGLGLKDLPGEFIPKWGVYFRNFTRIDPVTLAVGLVSLLIIVIAPKISKKLPGALLAILIVTPVVYFCGLDVETIGARFGKLPTDIPLPHGFELNMATINMLLPSAFTIAILGAIESLLSATVADGVTGSRTDSNTELIGQGLANVVVPLFGGIPVTGAIARTMTNITNGGRTPVAGIVHALVLLAIFLLLMPLINLVPMACLAAVLIVVSYNMSGWRTVRGIFKTPRATSPSSSSPSSSPSSSTSPSPSRSDCCWPWCSSCAVSWKTPKSKSTATSSTWPTAPTCRATKFSMWHPASKSTKSTARSSSVWPQNSMNSCATPCRPSQRCASCACAKSPSSTPPASTTSRYSSTHRRPTESTWCSPASAPKSQPCSTTPASTVS